MTCFWTNLKGVRQNCGSELPGAFVMPSIVSDAAVDPVYLVLKLLPECGPCFGSPLAGCDAIDITSATITSGSLWRDVDGAGCNLVLACADADGIACGNTATPNTLGTDYCSACTCLPATPWTPCELDLDVANRGDTWAVSGVDLVPVYDPDTSEYLGLGVPLSALLDPETTNRPHYGELLVDTDVGAGFVWKIATGTCF